MPSSTLRNSLFSRQQPGGFWVVSRIEDQPGDIWFVDSGQTTTGADSAGYGRNPDQPFLTLDYAIALTTASNGDTIYVMPGHTETLGADSAVDIDVAGLTIIGLGKGAARPTFTASAIAGDFKLAAASTHIENLLFLSGVDATTGMVEVSAADCSIVNCEFRDSVDQATDCLMVLDGSDRLLIDGCTFTMAAAAGANSAIAIGSSDDVEIKNCSIYGNFAVGAIDLRTAASNRINIHDCKIWTENAADIAIVDTITASTGWIGPNLYIMLQDNAANITTAVTGATFHMMDPVYICNLAGEKAMLSNWTASTHA
jgi:hypothetical protein